MQGWEAITAAPCELPHALGFPQRKHPSGKYPVHRHFEYLVSLHRPIRSRRATSKRAFCRCSRRACWLAWTFSESHAGSASVFTLHAPHCRTACPSAAMASTTRNPWLQDEYDFLFKYAAAGSHNLRLSSSAHWPSHLHSQGRCRGGKWRGQELHCQSLRPQ